MFIEYRGYATKSQSLFSNSGLLRYFVFDERDVNIYKSIRIVAFDWTDLKVVSRPLNGNGRGTHGVTRRNGYAIAVLSCNQPEREVYFIIL